LRPDVTRPELLIASRSADKVREIREILSRTTRDRLVSLTDAEIPEDPAESEVEAFLTFRENALAKARYFCSLTGAAVLADDSGIELDALGGAPGVFSKRFAARPDLSGTELDRANNQLLLEKLRGLPADRRGARYVCAAVLLRPHESAVVAIGTCRGIILEEARGHGGFGYDPLFLLPEMGRTFGQLDAAEKHRFSHRARAFRALSASL